MRLSRTLCHCSGRLTGFYESGCASCIATRPALPMSSRLSSPLLSSAKDTRVRTFLSRPG
jgi:hypothetical protein